MFAEHEEGLETPNCVALLRVWTPETWCTSSELLHSAFQIPFIELRRPPDDPRTWTLRKRSQYLSSLFYLNVRLFPLQTAGEAMTPIESTYSLDLQSHLDWDTMFKIQSTGHSRIPVYSDSPTNIIGILLVRLAGLSIKPGRLN